MNRMESPGLWGYALRHLDASRAAIFDNVIPIAGLVAAVLLLGDRPTAWHLVGGALVLIGAWYATGKGCLEGLMSRAASGPRRSRNALACVVLALLVLGCTAFGVPARTWTPAPFADRPPRHVLIDVGTSCGHATTAICRSSSMVGVDAGLHAPLRARQLRASTSESTDHRDQLPVPQLQWPIQQDLFARSGQLAPTVIAARAAGMDAPTARTGKIPAWATQLRAERLEKGGV